VQRLSTSPIPGVDGGAEIDQCTHELRSVCGGRDVHRRVAGVQVVIDVVEVVRRRLASRCADFDRLSRQCRRCRQHREHRVGVLRGDRSDQLQ
jgi:hypothetical protein